MQKAWTDEAWEEYEHWQTQDRKTLTNNFTAGDLSMDLRTGADNAGA
jgi:hypothetical protein